MGELADYYAILNLSPTAESEVIHAAYRTLALKYHPDTSKGVKSEADHRILEINQAYEVLSNPEKRKHYDLERSNTYLSEETIRNLLLWLTPHIVKVGSSKLKLSKEMEGHLLRTAEKLIHMGHKIAAQHLNGALKALHSKADPEIIFKYIKERLPFVNSKKT